MTFKLEIRCDNEAFADDPMIEVQRILQKVSENVIYRSVGACMDVNGNKVGTWEIDNEN